MSVQGLDALRRAPNSGSGACSIRCRHRRHSHRRARRWSGLFYDEARNSADQAGLAQARRRRWHGSPERSARRHRDRVHQEHLEGLNIAAARSRSRKATTSLMIGRSSEQCLCVSQPYGSVEVPSCAHRKTADAEMFAPHIDDRTRAICCRMSPSMPAIASILKASAGSRRQGPSSSTHAVGRRRAARSHAARR